MNLEEKCREHRSCPYHRHTEQTVVPMKGPVSMINKMLARQILMFTGTAANLGGAAFAADLPSHRAAPLYGAPPLAFTWTGFYLGGQIGYEWGASSTTATNYATGAVTGQPGYNAGGVAGGIHNGYNYQISQFVIGYEGAINGSSYEGSGLNNSGTISHSTYIPFESSIRGRAGIAWGRTLLFAAGGVAFGSLRNTSVNTLNGYSDTFDSTRAGWTVGVGVEYALSNNWSIRAEYRYTDYGHFNEFEGYSTGGLYSVNKHETDSKVQVGFSYKFDTGLLQSVSGLLRAN